MKHLKCKEDVWYTNTYYNIVEYILDKGSKYFPNFFYRKHILSGKDIYLPKWISKRVYDRLEKESADMIKNLKFE